MLLIVLAGCDDPSVAEYVYAGTQLAVEACIKRNTSSLVDASVIAENCIKTPEKHKPAGVDRYVNTRRGKSVRIESLSSSLE
jgi:hypothetical protein